jgi:hypothetical protein
VSSISSKYRCRDHRQFFFAVSLRLRPALIRAFRVLPSMTFLFHKVERHALRGQCPRLASRHGVQKTTLAEAR